MTPSPYTEDALVQQTTAEYLNRHRPHRRLIKDGIELPQLIAAEKGNRYRRVTEGSGD